MSLVFQPLQSFPHVCLYHFHLPPTDEAIDINEMQTESITIKLQFYFLEIDSEMLDVGQVLLHPHCNTRFVSSNLKFSLLVSFSIKSSPSHFQDIWHLPIYIYISSQKEV